MSDEHPVVQTSFGAVRGRRRDGVSAFLGIPYAAPPVAERRFVGPEPVDPWSETLDAVAFAPPMPQPIRHLAGVDVRTLLGDPWTGTDPALALNIWTSAEAGAGAPVVVFVHGGAFVAGTPGIPMMNAASFAQDGVVAVTLSYRLGIEGFLPLDGGETNIALRDQLAALRWVHAEISAFGGDPSQITFGGQSAGSACSGLLLTRSEARGLVHRAILQSGPLDLTLSLDQGRELASAIAARLGVPPTREAFSALSFEQTLAVQAVATAVPGSPGLGAVVFGPVRDDELVPVGDPEDAFPVLPGGLLTGCTSEEGNLYTAGNPELAVTSQMFTDQVFTARTHRLARAHTAAGGTTHLYEFGWRSTGCGGRLGACHAVELPFVFATTGAPGAREPDGLLGPGEDLSELERRTHLAWVNFVRSGEPGWAPISADAPLPTRIA